MKTKSTKEYLINVWKKRVEHNYTMAELAKTEKEKQKYNAVARAVEQCAEELEMNEGII